tara:strand:+ start:443 stop:673 length:231 start_codon:yes stop_codon:yes gene_type:complete
MATKLTKDLTRELTAREGLIVTLTETGITLKLKRHRSGIGMSWDQVIAAAGVKLPEGEMLGDLAEGLKKLGVKETA